MRRYRQGCVGRLERMDASLSVASIMLNPVLDLSNAQTSANDSNKNTQNVGMMSPPASAPSYNMNTMYAKQLFMTYPATGTQPAGILPLSDYVWLSSYAWTYLSDSFYFMFVWVFLSGETVSHYLTVYWLVWVTMHDEDHMNTCNPALSSLIRRISKPLSDSVLICLSDYAWWRSHKYVYSHIHNVFFFPNKRLRARKSELNCTD